MLLRGIQFAVGSPEATGEAQVGAAAVGEVKGDAGGEDLACDANRVDVAVSPADPTSGERPHEISTSRTATSQVRTMVERRQVEGGSDTRGQPVSGRSSLPEEANRGRDDGDLFPFALDQLPSTLVHHPMVPATEQDQVV